MIFAILKVIGIIILGLIALLLAAVFCVLFVPVRYKGSGKFDSPDIDADIRLSWLFGLLAVRIRYSDELTGHYRIAFVKRELFGDGSDDEAPEDDNYGGDNDRDVQSDTDTDKVKSDNENCNVTADSPGDDIVTDNVTVDTAEDVENGNTTGNGDKEDEKHGHNVKPKEHRNRRKNNKISKIKKSFGKLQKEYQDTKNRAAIGHLKEEFFIILKRICPKRFMLLLKFATGEPDKTGILLGIMAMFPVGYKNRWQITPDFESDKAYAKGSFLIKGRIFAISILAASLRILFDKNCRRLYNRISG